jgi:VIT1/CCC1 family predicted Fe2+/Mn2+ transporter
MKELQTMHGETFLVDEDCEKAKKHNKMKIFINIFAVIICVIAYLLTNYSMGGNNETFILLLIISLLITLCSTVFFKGSFMRRFLTAFPLSLILTSVVYILGNFYKTFLILCV